MLPVLQVTGTRHSTQGLISAEHAGDRLVIRPPLQWQVCYIHVVHLLMSSINISLLSSADVFCSLICTLGPGVCIDSSLQVFFLLDFIHLLLLYTSKGLVCSASIPGMLIHHAPTLLLLLLCAMLKLPPMSTMKSSSVRHSLTWWKCGSFVLTRL